jgi:hypothetical protein
MSSSSPPMLIFWFSLIICAMSRIMNGNPRSSSRHCELRSGPSHCTSQYTSTPINT